MTYIRCLGSFISIGFKLVKNQISDRILKLEYQLPDIHMIYILNFQCDDDISMILL
jgi:hypothetical protein